MTAFEHGSRDQSPGNADASVVRESYDALVRAGDAVSELQLIAPRPVVDAATLAMAVLLASSETQ
jgi:hypothetical protein